jgi:hypothetical protein
VIPDYTIEQFLKILATASGDEVFELIHAFQSCGCYVNGMSADELGGAE